MSDVRMELARETPSQGEKRHRTTLQIPSGHLVDIYGLLTPSHPD
jgi:hypothetical protein